MNIALLGAQVRDLPISIAKTLSDGNTCSLAFNKRGNLLAAGLADGRVVFWDFDTYGVAKSISHAHVSPVTSLMWLPGGKYLVTASQDRTVVKWNILTGKSEAVFEFEGIVTALLGRPRTKEVVVCSVNSMPVLLDLENNKRTVTPCPEEVGDGDDDKGGDMKSSSPVAVCFNLKGDELFVGGAKGRIWVVDVTSNKIARSYQIDRSKAAIKNVVISPCGKYAIVNSQDKSIRVFIAEDMYSDGGSPSSPTTLVCSHTHKDPVNQAQWKCCGFTPDSEYIFAGSAQKEVHNIYIWNRVSAQLEKMLEGPKETICDMLWHPLQPTVVSCSNRSIFVWTKPYVENWSAFAPGFTELEENHEYEEHESEFDIKSDDGGKAKEVDEDEDVDIGSDLGPGEGSDQEEFCIPIEIEPDFDPKVMSRKGTPRLDKKNVQEPGRFSVPPEKRQRTEEADEVVDVEGDGER